MRMTINKTIMCVDKNILLIQKKKLLYKRNNTKKLYEKLQ